MTKINESVWLNATSEEIWPYIVEPDAVRGILAQPKSLVEGQTGSAIVG
jgi:hypothetical protein